MLLAVQVIAVFLVAVSMSMALAHALELPGKLRLDQQTYESVQTIYYPGFTLGGIGEPLAIVATFILLVLMRDHDAAFWWTFAAFVAVLLMHGVFWFVTQPTNRYWMRVQHLSRAGARFFGVQQPEHSVAQANEQSGAHDWERLRNRWEYSHVIRAVLATVALVALAVSLGI